MKRVLIVSHGMEIGGAEKALLGLLCAIDTSEYQVDLFLLRHTGELLKYIPSNINLLPEIPQYSCLAVPFKNVIKKGQIGVAIGRFLGKRAATKKVKELGLGGDNDVALEYSHKYTLPYMPQISDKEYDLAISFLTPHYYVANKVKAKKKIAWIHTDYSMVEVDKESQLAMWDKYDWIASISNSVTNSFVNTFPELIDKIQEIPNIMPAQYINKLATEINLSKDMANENCVKLLSIGRFCSAKNFDNVPDICSRILKNGIDVKWYLIGYGGDEALIKERINEAGMQDYVIVLGKKDNPYPYINKCDIYVQPSRYEGKCVSVIEAQMLNKPVVITDYETSSSQLEDEVDGIIVPMDNQGCADGIVKLILDKGYQFELMENTKKRDYINAHEVNKIYQLIG